MYTVLPDVEFVGKVVRRNCFEISVDGELMYSSLQERKFPRNEDVVKAVAAVKSGQPIPPIGTQSYFNLSPQRPCSVM